MRILCKLGEMLLKSKPVRRRFSQQLIANLKHAFQAESLPLKYTLSQGTLIVESPDDRAVDLISRIFGIVSIAEIEQCSVTGMQDIIDLGLDRFRREVAGQRFAVRCRRVGQHDFGSQDVERRLGAVLSEFGTVDLTDPAVTCRLELRGNQLSLYTRTIPGAGGFPLGSQGRAVCLISGGIDSPVAAWHALKRGLRLDYLFCNLGGPSQAWGPLSTAKILADRWSYGSDPSFYTVDFTPLLAEFKRLDHRYRNILLKRFFYRAADHLCQLTGADAFITGEALGQVSSQTLSNLRTISRVTDFLPIRPLITLDKRQIIDIARTIGTLDISEHVPEFCNVAVRKPRTTSTAEGLEDLERDIPGALISQVFQSLTTIRLSRIGMPPPPVEFGLSEPPANARLVWIITAGEPVPGSLNPHDIIEMTALREYARNLEWEGPVVTACARGVMSRDLAAYLRDLGFEAYHLLEVK